MGSPFFSIIVPAYNTAPYLPRCIASLLDQSFRDFEVLLVNDGSTDNTASTVDMLQKRDPRVRGAHISHAGVGAARNHGLQMAQGDYVLFLDSDDALVPGALERIHASLENTPGMLCFNLLTRSLNDSEIPRHLREKTQPQYTSISETADNTVRGKVFFISACTHAYRLSLIRENHISFQEGLAFGEDRLFNLNYLKHCESVSYIKDQLYIYSFDRDGSGSHRFIPGMASLLMTFQAENVSTILSLCSGVSEEEKQKFRTKCFLSAAREAWKHLKLYYPSLSRHQQAEELKRFLSIPFPEKLYTKGLHPKQRLWLLELRWTTRLQAGWLMRLFWLAESILSRRKKK